MVRWFHKTLPKQIWLTVAQSDSTVVVHLCVDTGEHSLSTTKHSNHNLWSWGPHGRSGDSLLKAETFPRFIVKFRTHFINHRLRSDLSSGTLNLTQVQVEYICVFSVYCHCYCYRSRCVKIWENDLYWRPSSGRVPHMWFTQAASLWKVTGLAVSATSTAIPSLIYFYPPTGGTAAAVPPPFRPSEPALCGSCPLVTPYYCRLGDLLC